MFLFLISNTLLIIVFAQKLLFFSLEPLYAANWSTIVSFSLLSFSLIMSVFLYARDIKNKRQKHRKNLPLAGFEKVLVALSLGAILFSLIINMNRAFLGWDAVALYDARAKFLLQGLRFSDMISISKYDPKNLYYYLLYPPYTSLIHYFWYKALRNIPIGVYYSSNLAILGLVVYFTTKRFLEKRWAILLVFFTVTNVHIFSSSLTEYTNIPFTLQIFLGILLLSQYIAKREPWKLFSGIALVITSQWIRFLEPIWIGVIIAYFLSTFQRKRLFKEILTITYFAAFGISEYLSWNYFTNTVAKSPQIISFNFINIAEPIVGIFTGVALSLLIFFFSSWGIGFLIHIGALLSFAHKKRKVLAVGFLKYIIFFAILIYFGGLYFVSFQSDWWDKLGDSLIRSTAFLIPISGLIILSNIKDFIELKDNPKNRSMLLKSKIKAYLCFKYIDFGAVAFFVSWSLAFFVSLLDAIAYPGYVEKQTGIGFYYFLIAPLIVGFALKLIGWKGSSAYHRLTLKSAKFATGFFGLLFLLTTVLENNIYPNFIFSSIHVHPSSLIWPFILGISLYLFLIITKGGLKALLKHFTEKKYVIILILGIAGWIGISNIFSIIRSTEKLFICILQNPTATHYEKMEKRIGKFYDFTLFINENVPADAHILIPPQGFPWPQSGNPAYIRYFVYPRKVTRGKEYEPGIDLKEENTDFVLLTWGETETTQYGYTQGWPKFDIAAENIIYYDDLGEIYTKEGNYSYADFEGKKVWGVIKVKK